MRQSPKIGIKKTVDTGFLSLFGIIEIIFIKTYSTYLKKKTKFIFEGDKKNFFLCITARVFLRIKRE